jgi:hypothetical protein
MLPMPRRPLVAQLILKHVSYSMAVLFEMSNLLNTGLDKKTLAILVELCGALPPSLVAPFAQTCRSPLPSSTLTHNRVNPSHLFL